MSIKPLYNKFYFKFILFQMKLLNVKLYSIHNTVWHIDDVKQILNQLKFNKVGVANVPKSR